MIGLPPSFAGASQVSTTDVEPDVPERFVGAPGVARGVTAAEDEDGVLDPKAVTATTRNTYGVPLVRPVITADERAEIPSPEVTHVEPSVEY